jgi:serine/threonine protein kinase
MNRSLLGAGERPMSEKAGTSPDGFTPSLLHRVDQVCDQFEAAWKTAASTDQRPRIADYLGDRPEPERSALLRELIILEVEYRRQAGEQPQVDDYREWLSSPGLGDWIREHLGTHLPVPGPLYAARALVHEDSATDNPSTLSRSDRAGAAERQFLEPGTVIDQCRIESLLGYGGMGEVYLAEHTVLGNKVAVKVLPAQRAGDAEALRRFLQEMRAQACMSPHPNVAAAFHASAYQGRCYLVMEYVPGVDLAQHVRRHGPLSYEQACAWVRQIAVGLDYLHQHDIVHRDLKPSNLRLTPDGTVKILDLGLARHRPAEILLADGSLTPDGAVLGTLDYLAPEQAESAAQADARSDLYSLGCTFYYLLTGKAPFADRAGLEKIIAHARKDPPSLRQQRPGVPEAVAAIVERLLAKKPQDRYASAHDLIDALDKAARAMRSRARALVAPQARRTRRTAGPAERPEQTSPLTPHAVQRRRLRAPLLAAAGIGVIVLGFVMWRPWASLPHSPSKLQYRYTLLDVPGSTGTYALGLNDSGQIVGGFTNAAGTHGFLLDHGTYTTLNVPGSTTTQANGINNSGHIVGHYSVGAGPFHGFLLKNGTYSSIDVPGSTWTKANGINGSGQIVGEYFAGGTGHGFLLDRGIYTTIDVLGSGFTGARHINASGQIVGFYGVGNTCHGFLLSGGIYTTIDVLGSSSTSALGINDSGQIVGGYIAGVTSHGYLLDKGIYTTIDVLGSTKTEAFGINASGQVVGIPSNAAEVHGFLAAPAS